MIRATKPWNAKILIALVTTILLAMPAIAANNPGHDSLYIEQDGNSVVNGTLNITYLLTLEGNAYLKSYLDLIANGTIVGSSPSRNTIYATNTLLEIDAVSGGNIYLDRYGGTVLTGSPSARTDLNVSGNLYIYNPTGYTTLTVGNVAVCLANGTGCPTININGASSGGGWTNTTTETSTSLNVNVDTGTLYVDSTNNRVGVAISTLGKTFEVNGEILARQTSTQAGGTAGTLSPDSFGVNLWVNSRYNSSDSTTGWARAITIQNSTGNIGIGTANPGAKLDVQGTGSTIAFFNSTASETKLEIHNVAADGDPKVVWELPGTRAWQAGIDDSDSDKFKIGYAENTDWSSTVITIDVNGNVGIGDTTPSYTTEIQNLLTPIQLKVTGANSTGGIQLGTYMTIQGSIDVDNNFHRGLVGEGVFYDAITDTYNLTNAQYDRAAIEFLNSGHIGIFTESQDRSASPNLTSSAWTSLERMRITNTGLVGINLKSPTSTLQVNGTANVTYLTIASATAASCDLKAYTNGTVYCGSDATGSGGDGTAGWTNTTTTTSTSLNVGIGTTSPNATLDINSTGNLIIARNASTSNVVFKVIASGEVFSDAGYSTPAADLAEKFHISGKIEPGDVVIINTTKDETLMKSTKPYDRLVAGVISTRPGLKLGETGEYVALAGRVPVKVVGEVNTGDLLVTSSTPGKAMACKDYTKCSGAVLGKAVTDNINGMAIAIISLQ
jgi:hypothetical protein